jgi:hypothetical protein
LSSGRFDTAPTLAVSGTGGVQTLLLTGGASAAFAVFSLDTSATSAVGATDALQVSAVTIAGSDASTTISATIALYEDQTKADAGGTDHLGSSVTGAIVSFANSFSASIAGGTAQTATVASGFTQFTATSATFGNAQIGVNATHLDPRDRSTMLLTDLASAQIAVTGDLSGLLVSGATSIVAGGITYGLANPLTTATSASATFQQALDTTNRSLVLESNVGSGTFAAGTLEATVSFSGTSLSVPSVSGTIGTITRDGSTVDIPYITTFADYNQRIILVNRSSADAGYTIAFTPEAGVTAAGGTAATGTMPANSTLVLKATDVVTITGGTRTAGQIQIVATTGNIDVATTQVNLSDGSTDTLALQ